MSVLPIYNVLVGRQDQIEIPGATAVYPVGYQIQVIDNSTAAINGNIITYEYGRAATTLQQWGLYSIQGTASGQVVGLNTSSVTAAGYARVCVANTNLTAGYYAFFPVRGTVTCACTGVAGQSLSYGSQIKVINAATVASPETVSRSSATAATAIRQVSSIGYVHTTGTTVPGTSNVIRAYLYGDASINSATAIA